MTRALPLLLALSACASQPKVYGQSAFPVAPTFNPAVDAPITTGQPGFVGEPERLPPSPHRRVLPPTKEPGLWAGDAPNASRSSEGPPVFFGVRLPGLPVSDTEEDVGPARTCMALWDEALADTRLPEQVTALKPTAKRCMVAWMFRACFQALERHDDDMRDLGILFVGRQKMRRLLQRAEEFTSEECKGVQLTQPQVRLLDRLRAALFRNVKFDEGP